MKLGAVRSFKMGQPFIMELDKLQRQLCELPIVRGQNRAMRKVTTFKERPKQKPLFLISFQPDDFFEKRRLLLSKSDHILHLETALSNIFGGIGASANVENHNSCNRTVAQI